MPKKPDAPLSQEDRLDEKLEEIIGYLKRAERRDRMRTIAGFFRSMLGLIPLILLLWSAWYFFQNGGDIIEKITKEAVEQSAAYSQESLLKQLQEAMPRR